MIMEEWDRLAMGAVGILAAIYPAYAGYKYVRSGRWGPALGLWVLALAGIVVPVAEAYIAGQQ